MEKSSKREQLIKLQRSQDFFKGCQYAVDEMVALKKEIEDESTFANHIGYTDIYPFEIIERKTEKSIIIRRMDSELDKNWHPEIVPGGFVGHCTNNQSQVWVIVSNKKNKPFTIRKHKDGNWYSPDKMRFSLSDEPCRHYDYNF